MNRTIWRPMIIALYAAIIGAVGIMAGTYIRFVRGGRLTNKINVPFVRPAFNGKRQVTILVLGLDVPDKLNPGLGQRSDSMMLMNIDLNRRTVDGISIPRDTLAQIPGRDHKDKINAAYSFGGVKASIAAVEALTGVSPDYYVVSDVGGFKKLVDMIGGIDLDVEKQMDYDDEWQNLHIHLKPGRQHLDGEHAMEYVRFRHDQLGDITRMQRQQRFLKAVAQRMVSLSNLPRLPAAVAAMRTAVQTNMESEDLVYLATTLRNSSGANIRISTLPGEPRMIRRISYYVIDEPRSRPMIARLFGGGSSEESAVEVLNGSSVAGLARTAARRLTSAGVRVHGIGNAHRHDVQATRIVYSGPDPSQAEHIATLLGVGEPVAEGSSAETDSPSNDDAGSRRTKQSTPASRAITVILGRDYSEAAATSPSYPSKE